MTPGEPRGPIARVIAASARQPYLTLLATALLAAWGWWALLRTPLDAIPDLSDTQVIVFTEWPGRAPGLVEDQVTYPLTTALLSTPEVESVRGQSFFGLSFVYAIFHEGTDLYWARSRVLEKLSTVQGDLPDDARPTLGPDATGVGWVYMYALVDRTGNTDLSELRALQDWSVRFALESVPGVAEVASLGGAERQVQVVLDPLALRAHGVTQEQVVAAVQASNRDAGGRVLEIAGHEQVIRGRGYLRELDDLRLAPVGVGADGVPVLLSQVAEVTLGQDMKRGIAELDGQGEVVGGIVVMRQGENALDVIRAVEERLDEVRRGLPAGVEIVETYDRSRLIEEAIGTLRGTLIEEMLVVSAIIFLFLLHVRSALVPVLVLPVAVVASFVPMLYQGLGANIMSLGGIAVAIGAMVDASIIVVENVHKRLEAWEDGGREGSRTDAVIAAMQEVGPSIFFSLLVITVSFLPVFTLQGTEGRLFRPLASTKTWSMAFAAVLAVTATPALAVLLIRGRVHREDAHPLNRGLVRAYTPVVRFVVRRRRAVVVAAALVVTATVPAWLALESEFMPPLNEGTLLYMPTAPPGMSVTEAANVVQAMDREIAAFPEVETVFGKMGRAETATDPAPLDMAETVVVLKPRDQWREGMTWDRLVGELDRTVRYPGMPNLWWMPIMTRTEMLATGIRTPLAAQILGSDLAEIEAVAIAIEEVVAAIPGVRSAYAERSSGGFFLDVVVDRVAAARHGVSVSAVQDVVEMAIGGMNVGEWIDGRARFPIAVRYAEGFRDDPEALGEVLVATASGAQVPLAQVADLQLRTGPPMIRSEAGQLAGYVFIDPGDLPLAELVAEARERVAAQVERPAGTRVAWTGQFRYLERAKERLVLVVPLTLGLVVLLLWLNTRSLVETGLVLLAVPFSLVGAVWLLWALDYHLSVAVWVGLIALAGLDAETGVVMLLYLKLAWQRHLSDGRLRDLPALEEAIVEGAARRIRPKLMTVLTTMLGLLPLMWSDGAGADVMRRIAAPMIGGLVTSFLMELTVYPAVFALWKERRLPG